MQTGAGANKETVSSRVTSGRSKESQKKDGEINSPLPEQSMPG
jgi:hypothetical protein